MLTKDFEVLDKRFEKLVFGNVHLDVLYTGTRWAEGPAYFPAGKYLIWSDIPNNRLMRYDETDGSVSVFWERCNNHNGHTVDREGRLISCEHGGRCVSRIEHRRLRHGAGLDSSRASGSTRPTTSSSSPTARSGSPTRATASIRDYEGDARRTRSARCYVYRLDPARQEDHASSRPTS